jgi:hypothetical protein
VMRGGVAVDGLLALNYRAALAVELPSKAI